MLRAELTDFFIRSMNKKTDNEDSTKEFQEILILLKKALTFYVIEV